MLANTLRDLIRARGYSVRSFATKLGISHTAVQKTLEHNNMRAYNLARYADALGYALVIVPKDSKLPEEHYVVTRPDPDEPIDDRVICGRVKHHYDETDELIG